MSISLLSHSSFARILAPWWRGCRATGALTESASRASRASGRSGMRSSLIGARVWSVVGVVRIVIMTLMAIVGMHASALSAPFQNEAPRISNPVIEKAVANANAKTGRSVKVKFTIDPNVPGFRVVQSRFVEKSIATNVVGGHTKEFQLNNELLKLEFPTMFASEDAQIEVLTLAFVHEFAHMPVSEGGQDIEHTDPPNCAELKGRERESKDACARVRAIGQDATLTSEQKCDRVKAICQFMDHLMKAINIQSSIEAAGNCTTAPNDVDVSDGQIFDGCCPECCSTESGCREVDWVY